MRRSTGSRQRLIEGDKGEPSTTREQVEAVRAALEEAGIEFLNGDAQGVRLHPKGPKRKRRSAGWNCRSSRRWCDIGSMLQRI
jgi:hypothetical protein